MLTNLKAHDVHVKIVLEKHTLENILYSLQFCSGEAKLLKQLSRK